LSTRNSYKNFSYPLALRERIEGPQRQNQPSGERESVCGIGGECGSQCTWCLPVLFAVWLPGREVHVSSRPTRCKQRGKTLLLSWVSLRVPCRLQRQRQCASQLLSGVALAATSPPRVAEHTNALSGYTSDGSMAGEGNPDDPAQVRLQMSEHVKVVGVRHVAHDSIPGATRKNLEECSWVNGSPKGESSEGQKHAVNAVIPKRMYRKTRAI
jgi:hypothetical protein